ncbi:MAG: T9SS type A sorting domain-containing protein, partial [candidate division Zixibacteria bacterium]|nr:T9SS type A sorting domain-containing protein [candidate division Zixibacteria bacterium]
NSTAVTYDLGGQYQQLYSDGTLGGVTSDASVRNCEGKIYIPYSGSNNPPSAPGLYSPSYGENIDERQPYLIVNNASDPDGQDLTYSFQVASDDQFSNIVASVNGVAEGSPRTQWQVSVILDPDTDYYWRVRAHDGITYGNYSSTGMFHINAGYNNPPSAPVVYSPVNGDTITSRQPYLIVNNASDPDGDTKTYSYEVARDNQFNNMVALVYNIQEGTTRTQWQVDVQLEVNDDYYWRCRAHDGTVYGDYSAVAGFRVAGANSAPGAPSICQPGIGDTVDVARPLLYVYNASDPDGDDLTYLYEIYDMDSSLVSVDSSVAENPDSTAWQVQASLEDDASYWWRVRAYDGSVYGEYSDDGLFTVDMSDRPGPTTIRWPEPGDTIGTIQPTLWINNAIDPDGDSLVYSFQLYDSSWQPVEEGWPIPETPDTTGWQTPELQDLSLYYWRARAFDGIEFGDFTQNGHFYINVNYQPTVPVVMNPAQGDTIINPQPTLWLSNSSDPDNDPLSYHIQLFTADSILLAQATEIPEGDDSTGWTLPGMLENETSYAWRARAYDGKLYSDWCDGVVFTVYIFGQAAGNGIPELMGDARQGEVVNSSSPVLSIANAAGPSQYYFEVASDAEFEEDNIIASSGAVDAGDEATVWQVNPDLSTGKMYYWRASSDQNNWSDPDSFFVSLGIHVFPNPYRPGNGHEVVTFRNLPDDSQIKVATVSGKIVKEFKNVSEGDYQWDVHNESGSALATGVYLYIINYPGGTSNGKLAVIR